MNRHLRGLLTLLCFGASVALFASSADAAQIKKIYRGTAAFDADDTAMSIDIGTPVTLSKSIVLMDWPGPTNSSLNPDRDQNNFFTIQFEDSQTLFIDRAGGTTDAHVSWQVIEFEEGVFVQRGISSMANATYASGNGRTKTIDLTTNLTNYKNAVPIAYTKGLFASNSNDNESSHLFHVVGTFSNNSQLTLTRLHNASSSRTIQITWQVVEFLIDASVQTGTVTMSVNVANDTVRTGTVSLAGTGQNAMLFFGIQPKEALPASIGSGDPYGMDSRILVRGRIKDEDEVEFVRRYAPNTANTDVIVTYYVVDFKENPTIEIQSSTNADPAVVNTATAHGFKNGDSVKIMNHAVNTIINGVHTITVTDSDTFTVDGIDGNGNGVATGHVFLDNDNLGFGDADTGVTSAHTATAVIDSTANNYSDISVASNATPVRITVGGVHGWADQSRVRISGYTSINALNGAWTIRTGGNCAAGCSTSQFELVGSTASGLGGAVSNTVGPEQLIYFAVASSTDASPIVVTKNSHGLQNGEIVQIWNHTTNTTANGIFIVNNVTTNTFELKYTSGTGAGAGSNGTMIVGVRSTTTSVTPDRTPVYFSLAGLATTSTNTADLHNFSIAQSLVDSTTLSTIRHYNSRSLVGVDFNYQLYEFPPLTIILPNAGTEIWVVDDPTTTVTWKSSADVATHDWQLQYSTDGGSNWNNFGSVCGDGDDPCTGTSLSTGTVTVKVPDLIGLNVKVRVYDSDDTRSDVTLSDQRRQSDASDKVFKIRGSITNVITEPVAETPSAYWGYGASGREIRWEQHGTIGTVRIDVDYNGDEVFDAGDNDYGGDTSMDGFPRATGVNGTALGSNIYKYDWSSSWDVSSDDLMVKVSAVTDAAQTGLVTATSANIEIRPTVNVTVPVSSAQWGVGRTNRVEWTRNGSLGNLDIYISFNSGVDYYCIKSDNSIASSPGTCAAFTTAGTYVGDAGYWDWVTPSTATRSTTCKIKIQKNGDTDIVDIGPHPPAAPSSGTFEVVSSLDMTAPLTTDAVLRVNNPRNISWTVGGGPVGNLDIFYDANWSGCENTATSDVTCWTIIPGAAGLASGSSPFSWSVPDSIGTNVGIRIEDSTNRTLIYDKDGPFTVKGQIFNVTVANVAGTVRVGATPLISWSKNGSLGNVDIALSQTGGSSYTAFATNISGTSYNLWTTVSADMGENCKIKVYKSSDADPTTGVAGETAGFKIRGNLTNATTNAADYNIGQVVKLSWTDTPSTWSDSVNIYYSSNGSSYVGYPATPLVTVPATGAVGCTPAPCFEWTLLSSYPVTQTYKMKVEHNAYTDTLAETTTFAVHGTITLGGEADAGGQGTIWKIGEQKTISWTKSGTLGNITIKYSKNGGTDSYPYLITTIDADNNSAYSWCVGYNDACAGQTAGNDAHHPDLVIGASDRNNQIKIKLESTTDTLTKDTTVSNFIIQKQYENVAVPLSTLFVDDVNNISWTTKGRTGAGVNVILSYDTASGSGGFGGLINNGAATSDAGGYSWSVPDVPGFLGQNVIMVRVKSEASPDDVYGDTSLFRIRGKIDTLVPTAAGLAYDYNTSIPISWENHGALGTVKLLQSNGGSYTQIKTVTPANDGPASGAWQSGDPGFPPAVGTYTVRVEQVGDESNVFVISANTFKVKGVLTMTSAATNGIWARVGETPTISWTRSPTGFGDGQLQLYYSTTGATTCGDASWQSIASNLSGTSHSSWTVPDAAVSATFRLMVKESGACGVNTSFDVSEAATASVKGRLTSITTPGSPWLIGTPHDIGWQSFPSAQGDVMVELSLNGGAYGPITGNAGTSTVTSQSSPFPWTIQENVLPNPGDFEANAHIRVKLISDPTVVLIETSTPVTIKKRYTGVAVPAGTLVVGEVNAITWNTWGNTGTPNQVLLNYDTSAGAGSFSGQINGGIPITDNETYNWTVDAPIGLDTVVVRVKSNAFPAQVMGDSGIFSVKGKVTPDANIGNLTLVVGQTGVIDFTKDGAIGNLKIEHLFNGLNPTVITPGPVPGPEGTNETTSFNWNPVIAVDGAANSVIDTSAGAGGTKKSTLRFTGLGQTGAIQATAVSVPFAIRGSVHTLQFDSAGTEGQVLYIGDAHLIRWKNNGNLGNVRILMDSDGDGFDESLTGPDPTYSTADNIPYNYDGDGAGSSCGSLDTDFHCWEWEIPDTSSNNVLIRIESLNNPWHATNPLATFSMTNSGQPARIRGTYTNITPTTNVKWKVGSTNNIDWTPSAAGMGTVNIILRYDSDNNGSIDATSSLATGTAVKPFPWVNIAAGLVTEKAVIRIQQNTDGTNTVFGESQEFKIKPLLTLSLPNSNADQWVVGTQYDITWAAPQGAAPSFKINVSTDGGSTWNDGAVTSANKGGEIAANAPSAANAYTWAVPDIMTNQGLVRIRKAGDSDIEASDESDSFFYVKGSITNVHIKDSAGAADPTVPIDLPIATTKYVTWNYTGSLGTVEVSVTTNADGAPPTYNPVQIGTCVGTVSVGASGSGSCTWSIPNSPSPNVRVKVTSTANANWQTVNGLSFAAAGPDYNDIVGSITAVSVVSDANGTDAVVGNNPKTILWTPNGAISAFDILYRIDNGSWVEIANNVAGTVQGSDRTWPWPVIPDTISSDVDYRVVDHNNPTKTWFDSTAAYRIRGSIVMTNPAGSNTLTVGVPYDITWTKSGSIGNIKIELSNDNFASDIRTIVGSYASANSPYAWTPSATVAPVINYADMNSQIMKVRLTSIGGIPVTNPAVGAFTIIGQITNVQPNSSATVWHVGENKNITWSQIGNIGAVDIFYRTSGGATPYDIPIVTNHLGHTNGSNSYPWNPVHDVNSESVWIQVKDNGNPTGVFSNSAAAFSVRPEITTTLNPDPTAISPAGLVAGTSYPNLVHWSYTGTTISTVNVRYDVDGSGTFAGVIQNGADVDDGSAGVNWTVPNGITLTDAAKIRVVDTANGNVVGDFGPFKVRGGISNVQPSAVNRTADTTMNVTWDYSGNIANFDVYYSPSSGAPSTSYVQIGSMAAGSCSSGSCSFSWLDTEASNIDAVLNTGRVKVTNALATNNPLYVEKEGAADFKRGASVSNLTVFNGPYINVGDTAAEIIWTKLKGLATGTQMKIDYTKDPDSPTWVQLTAGTDNDASFIWPGGGGVPGTLDDLNNGIKLKITQVNPDNSLVNLESATLVIRALINVTEPTGSGTESWGLLEDRDIKFTVKGLVNTVNIYYAPDGVTFGGSPINTGGPIDVTASGLNCNDGVTVCVWQWQDIPVNTALSTSGYNSKVRVRVEDPNFQKVNNAQDDSGGFQLRGSITAVTPTNNQNLLIGTPLDIVWTPVGNILKYDVQYSYAMSGGASWNPIAECTNVDGADAGGGNKKCTWIAVADTISNKVLFRVLDHNNPNTFVDSGTFAGGPFNYIKGQLTLSSPTNSDTWTVGTAYNPSIRWNKTGTIGDLKIEYSTSGGFLQADRDAGYVFTVVNNLASGPDGVNNYSWQAGVIPSPAARKLSDTGKIRIINLSAPAGTELIVDSLAFKIRPAFAAPPAFTQPIASTVWSATDTDTVNQVVSWTSISGTNGDGTAPTCFLEYTLNGTDYTPISGAGALNCTQGANNFTWSPMADLKSNSVQVKVTYTDFTGINTESPQFAVRPKITITPTPDANTKLTVGSNYPNIIRWTYLGDTTGRTVEIHYDTGLGGGYVDPAQELAEVAASAGQYTWNNVPNIISNAVKIRVRDKNFTSAEGESVPFKVIGGLTLAAPADGATWYSNVSQNIQWTSTGTYATVKAYYDLDSSNGLSWTEIGTAPRANGSIPWTPPTTVTNKARVRITNLDNETDTFSQNNADFKLSAKFDVSADSEDGVVYTAESDTETINWTVPNGATGIGNIKLYYSNNGTAPTPTWIPITEVAGSATSYVWDPVPGLYADITSTTHKFKITQSVPDNEADAGSTGNPNAIGAGVFVIKPVVELVRPGNLGNETLKVGTAYPIKIKKQGDVHSVDLYYSHDGGAGNYVKINGGTAVDISGSPDVNGEYTFNWTPQESHTLTAGGFPGRIKVKIVDPSVHLAIEDVQSNGTKLTGDLILNTPSAGGIILEVGDTYAITWTKFSISNVRLFFSTDGGIAGGGSYPPDGSPNIATVAATPATLNWPGGVPDQIGTNLRVRIMDDDNALVATESLNAFAIRGKLVLDTPFNGQTLKVDEVVDVQWTPKGTLAPNRVRLEYSTDNFASAIFPMTGPSGENYSNLVPNAHNMQQTVQWRVPNNVNNTVRIRVIHNVDPNVKGTTTADFKIVGHFALTQPTAGLYKVNDPLTISWVWKGHNSTQARVEYSTNSFTNESQTTLITTVNATDQSFPWTIPNSIGPNVKVRVKDPAYNGTTVFTQEAVSDEFEIRGQIKFNSGRTVPGPDSPLGGEVWLIGTEHMLQWEKHGTIPSVKVEYKVGAGAWDYVSNPVDGDATSVSGDTFNWEIPDEKGLNNVKIRVSNAGNSVEKESNLFTIRAGFSWTNPSAADQVFDQGTTYILSWANNGTVSNVDLKYSTNGDAVYDGDADPNYVFMKDAFNNDADGIINGSGATGTFNWPIPTNIAASKDVYLVIADNTDPDAKNVSPKVKIAGKLNLEEPDNDPNVERWGVTTSQLIQWTMVGNINTVKIDYTKDITAPTPVWETPMIANPVLASALQYNWTNIPLAAVSSKAAVRVRDTVDDSGTVPAISPLFKITGTFTPSAPVLNDVWLTTGTSGAMNNPQRNIVWSTQGVIAQADLYYSTTGNQPGAWTLINTGAPIVDGGAGGNFAWTVPQVFSDDMVIRIQDHDDPLTLVDTAQFTVRGHINLTQPVGGELWGVGEVQSITWDSVGIVGTPNEVYIYYKKGVGGAWIQLQRPTLEYNIPNTGSFAWTPPESELSTAAYVKIENIIAPTDPKYVATQSPAAFKLMRRYQLVDPDGGEVYTAGQAKDILWNKWGTPVGDVRIDLALDGVNFTTNLTPSTPNDGVYSWTPLANQVAPAAKIRIRDFNDTANEKPYISGSPFVIRATLILDAMPATVNIGEVYDILWTRAGDIPNVKLVYTTTGNFALDSRVIEDLNGNPMAGGIVPNQDSVSGNPTRGRHRWMVPDLILSERANLRLRVVDPNDDPGSENISAPFRIIPKFTVVTPNGNANPALTDKLKVGVPYAITWTSTSSSAVDKTPSVTILYTTNGGEPYPFTITTTANDGSYDWIVPATGGVPDDISSQVKVKVVSANAAEATALAQDASNENVMIVTNFTLTTPNGGATYDVGDPLTVAWTKIGSSANVQLHYSTAGTDFSSPVLIASPTPNDLSELWPGGIPNAIGNNVRVRIKSTTDDGEDISDTSFRIRGKIVIVNPGLSTPVPIGGSYNITWNTFGTIPNVHIVYDTADGAGGYPNSIATGIANTNSHNWTNIPDTGTNQARLRVIDSRPTESDVIGQSQKFNIVGNFNVQTPVNNDVWIVGTPHDITWKWGGTIPRVKISYTTNPALPEADLTWTEIITINYGAGSGDGGNGTQTRTHQWTIPDTIAPVVRVKVENADDASVYDVMTGTFAIRGGFTLTAPVLNDRWVTYDQKSIAWTTSGTIPAVKIEYSYDLVNFTNPVTLPNAANYANNGTGLPTTYPWTIHDPGIANVPKPIKIRISDFNDPNTNVISPAFNIDYYDITWNVRDLLTNSPLSQLTVNEVKASDPLFVQWSEAGVSTPRMQKTPFGTWVTTFSKSGFGDGVQVVVANSDQNITLFMETSTVHIWLADSRYSYNPDTDTLDVLAWLSRDGSIATGGVSAVYKIYDGATLMHTLTDNAIDAAGFFSFQVASPTNLVAGKTYSAICEITVGTGGVFKTPTSLEITTASKLEEVVDTVNSVLDVPISVVQANIQSTLDAQTSIIQSELANQTSLIQTTLSNFESTISNSIISLESAAEQSLVSAQTLEDTALKFSWKAVVAPNPALTNDTILLQAQGPKSLFPYLSVYNHRNRQVIANGLMTEDLSRPGNYSFAFVADQGDFEPGEAYTYVVTEDITGGLVAGSGFVESISLTSVAGLAAAAPAAEKAAKEAVKAIKELEEQMAKGGDIKDTMKLLRKAVDDIQYAASGSSGTAREEKMMRDRVAEITDKLRELATDQGLSFDELFQKAIDESDTIQDIRTRAGSINQAVDLIGAVVEKRLGGVEEPIVDVLLEPAT